MKATKNTELLQTRVPPKTHKAVEKEAAVLGVSVADWLRMMIHDQLTRKKESDKITAASVAVLVERDLERSVGNKTE